MGVVVELRCMNCSGEHAKAVEQAGWLQQVLDIDCPRCGVKKAQLVIGSQPKGSVPLDVKNAA